MGMTKIMIHLVVFLVQDWSKHITWQDIRGYHPGDIPQVSKFQELYGRQ